MKNNFTDLVIIGGGATGTCIAYEATKRGLSVVLLDSGDIAGGTSCRSTKLLHGGVRYLELAFKTFDINQLNLVKEALIERGYWLREAPFLSNKLELVLPSINCFNHIYNFFGLKIYDYLSGEESIGRSKSLSSYEVKEIVPLLKGVNQTGIAYSDGQFNDARLSLLMALSAEKEGAIIKNYCKVVDLEKRKNGTIKSVISEESNGLQQCWNAKAVINATGIHADSIRSMADSNIDNLILASRGVHIVLKQNLCSKDFGLLIPSTEDGRILFALPFYGHTLVGTTDTSCSKKNAKRASTKEQKYLINHLQKWFPELGEPLITSSWAGARPLIKPNNEFSSSSRVVREHLIETLPSGLISAMGGKWTTCRAMALDTLQAVEALIGEPLKQPKSTKLLGADKTPELTKELLKKQATILREYLPKTSLLEKQISHIQSQYGLEAIKVIANSKQSERQPLSEIIPLCKAEIIQSITNEHAKNPTDILARRTRLAMVDIKEAERLLPFVQEQLVQNEMHHGSLNLEK